MSVKKRFGLSPWKLTLTALGGGIPVLVTWLVLGGFKETGASQESAIGMYSVAALFGVLTTISSARGGASWKLAAFVGLIAGALTIVAAALWLYPALLLSTLFD